jgi:hypothetical protein
MKTGKNEKFIQERKMNAHPGEVGKDCLCSGVTS